jgi:hypothetical protein
MTLTYLQRNLACQLMIPLSIHLGDPSVGMPQRDLGPFESVNLPHLGPATVPYLVRMPGGTFARLHARRTATP